MARDFLLKHIPNELRMLELGQKFARACSQEAIIFLYGNLGAGKTTLARGFLQGLGHKGTVKSPTYTIVENYHFEKLDVFHFDFYRVKDIEELEYIGLADYFRDNAISLIEWPENGGCLLPPVDLSCYIESQVLGRNVKLVAHTEIGRRILRQLI